MTKAQYDNHIEDDEFHPEPRRAAVHADRKAREASFGWVVNELNRLLTSETPLSLEQGRRVEELTNRRQELAATLVKEDDDEPTDTTT